MEQITTVGLDLAKSVFQVHDIGATGEVFVCRRLRRSDVITFFSALPPCLVGMEACGTAHYWGRESSGLQFLKTPHKRWITAWRQKMDESSTNGPRPSEGARRASEEGPGPGVGRGGRMSRQRKRDGVLRLLRGEDLELVSPSLGVTASRLSEWRDAFLSGGEAALATREKDNRDLEIERFRAKLGEVLLDKELLESKIDVMERGHSLGRRRSKR